MRSENIPKQEFRTRVQAQLLGNVPMPGRLGGLRSAQFLFSTQACFGPQRTCRKFTVISSVVMWQPTWPLQCVEAAIARGRAATEAIK
jgi:hypothetical protein